MSRVSDLLDEWAAACRLSNTERGRPRLPQSLEPPKTLDANIFLTRRERLDKRIAQLKETMEGIAALIKGMRPKSRVPGIRAKAENDLRKSDE